TVSMITQYADVNRSTFYDHFSNKSELVEEILYDVLEGLKEEILEPFKNKKMINNSKITPTTVRIFQYIEENKEAFYALSLGHHIFKHHLEQLFLELFSKDIRMELHCEIGEPNYEMFLYYQTNATLGLIFNWI